MANDGKVIASVEPPERWNRWQEKAIDLIEPPGGWSQGMHYLIVGLCPWCGKHIQSISVSSEYGVTWACLEGCNP